MGKWAFEQNVGWLGGGLRGDGWHALNNQGTCGANKEIIQQEQVSNDFWPKFLFFVKCRYWFESRLKVGLLSVWTIRYAKSPDVHGQNLIETAMGYFWQKITGSATWAWYVPAPFSFNPIWCEGGKNRVVFNCLETNGWEKWSFFTQKEYGEVLITFCVFRLPLLARGVKGKNAKKLTLDVLGLGDAITSYCTLQSWQPILTTNIDT